MTTTLSQPTPVGTMLIVDDEANIRRVLQAIFVKEGFDVQVAESAAKAIEIAKKMPIRVLVTDLIMPDMNGVELLQKIKTIRPEAIAVMITAYATIKTCVDAMRYGASDYVTKPFDVAEIKAVVSKLLEKANSAPAKHAVRTSAKETTTRFSDSKSLCMQEIETMVRRAAASRATVLISGESGTGKELVARALHEQSDRSGGPFIAVSCAALSGTLLESELFGHDKSAFTGATAERKGRFELADGGTLFLDEIGDISLSVQIKLLRVLQQREFERVGGNKTIKVDVRLVAATNADLERLISENKFREDLYYRVNVVNIDIPPLRDRVEDIPDLAATFLRKFNKENNRNIQSVSESALAALSCHPWPGNVRELENTIERCVVMSDDDLSVLELKHLPASLRQTSSSHI